MFFPLIMLQHKKKPVGIKFWLCLEYRDFTTKNIRYNLATLWGGVFSAQSTKR